MQFKSTRFWQCARKIGVALCLGLPAALPAQSPFSAVITVNDAAITGFELEQRIMLLTFFNTPGDVQDLARKGLIDDRLRTQELTRAGLALNEEGLAQALEEFAGRANLTAEQFITVLGQNGIDESTLRDYVSIGVAWRDYVRSVFSDRVRVTEADIDFALSHQATAATGIEVLLSEIIIPAPPQDAARVQAEALAISRITSTAAFEAEARRLSAVPSRDQGGRLDWTPLSNYPAPLQDLLLGLNPGEVTPPLEITNAVALLQLRDIRETGASAQGPVAIDYATFLIAGGRSASALAQAAGIVAQVDTCNDLYAVGRTLPQNPLSRQSVAPAAIPQDIALELAKMDAGEVSTALTSADGSLVFLMLCSREQPLPEGLSRADVETQLRGQRLAAYADALLADLRAAATIVGE
jgi:peptidyl-prolyl cis-trans isomerase SurA